MQIADITSSNVSVSESLGDTGLLEILHSTPLIFMLGRRTSNGQLSAKYYQKGIRNHPLWRMDLKNQDWGHNK